MPVARIYTRVPEESTELVARLRARGYTVELVDPGDFRVTPADLEIKLDRMKTADALAAAARFGREHDADVFVAAGIPLDEAALHAARTAAAPRRNVVAEGFARLIAPFRRAGAEVHATRAAKRQQAIDRELQREAERKQRAEQKAVERAEREQQEKTARTERQQREATERAERERREATARAERERQRLEQEQRDREEADRRAAALAVQREEEARRREEDARRSEEDARKRAEHEAVLAREREEQSRVQAESLARQREQERVREDEERRSREEMARAAAERAAMLAEQQRVETQRKQEEESRQQQPGAQRKPEREAIVPVEATVRPREVAPAAPRPRPVVPRYAPREHEGSRVMKRAFVAAAAIAILTAIGWGAYENRTPASPLSNSQRVRGSAIQQDVPFGAATIKGQQPPARPQPARAAGTQTAPGTQAKATPEKSTTAKPATAKPSATQPSATQPKRTRRFAADSNDVDMVAEDQVIYHGAPKKSTNRAAAQQQQQNGVKKISDMD